MFAMESMIQRVQQPTLALYIRRCFSPRRLATTHQHLSLLYRNNNNEDDEIQRKRKLYQFLPQNSHSRCVSTSMTSRQDAAEPQQTLRERAGDMRQSAVEHYQEFRAHPRESARHGALTAGHMLRMYGPVFVGTYLTLYVSTLGVFFAGVQSGILDPVVLFQWLGTKSTEASSTVQLVVEWMNHHTWTAQYAPWVEKNPSVANLAVAWIAVKFTEPVRLAVALPVTPRIARYVGWTAAVEKAELEEAIEKVKEAEKAGINVDKIKDQSAKEPSKP